MKLKNIEIEFLTLLFFLFLFSKQLIAQEMHLTIQNSNISRKDVFNEIESQTQYSIAYKKTDIDEMQNISIALRDVTLEKALEEILKDTGVTYKIVGYHIILVSKKREQETKKTGLIKYTINGYIEDISTGERLINANVYDADKLIGTASNVYGFYSLTLPEGTYKIVYSFIGYEEQVKEVQLNKDLQLNIQMKHQKSLDEVKIVGNNAVSRIQDTRMSVDKLDMKTVESLPSFLGEQDVIKTLQLLPGVEAGTEASAGLYVRGGDADQNLILLDGVPVYNCNHLFGFFSIFTPEAIKSVTLYKGGFPARYGGRLSSVVDVRLKEGNNQEMHGELDVGLISSKIHLEGPIANSKTSYSISARRTYIDALVYPFLPEDNKVRYCFYDLNAKVNHQFSDKDHIYFSIYKGEDKYNSKYSESYSTSISVDKDGMNWGNTISALRWNHKFNNKLFVNSTFTFSKYFYNTTQENTTYYYETTNKTDSLPSNTSWTNSTISSGIDDLSYKCDFDWYPNYKNEIKFGGDYIYHAFKPSVQTQKQSESDPTVTGDEKKYCSEANVFFEDNLIVSDRLKCNLGVHGSLFYVDNSKYYSIEPRANLRYILSEYTTIKASYSYMQQYLHLLSSSALGLPSDLWVPVTDNIKPQKSQQYAIGSYYSPNSKFSFSMEGYFKQMQNLIEYKDGATYFSNSIGWENKVEMGNGRAYGLEFMARKEVGKTQGWISYTLAKSEKKFTNINSKNWFPSKYDRRHNFNIVVTHKFSDNIELSATWLFASGYNATVPVYNIKTNTSTYSYNPSVINSYSDVNTYFPYRNNFRLPATHRLDLGVKFIKEKKHGTRIWNLSVYNVYCHQNPFYVYSTNDSDGNLMLKQVSLLPIIPSVSYTFKF